MDLSVAITRCPSDLKMARIRIEPSNANETDWIIDPNVEIGRAFTRVEIKKHASMAKSNIWMDGEPVDYPVAGGDAMIPFYYQSMIRRRQWHSLSLLEHSNSQD